MAGLARPGEQGLQRRGILLGDQVAQGQRAQVVAVIADETQAGFRDVEEAQVAVDVGKKIDRADGLFEPVADGIIVAWRAGPGWHQGAAGPGESAQRA